MVDEANNSSEQIHTSWSQRHPLWRFFDATTSN